MVIPETAVSTSCPPHNYHHVPPRFPQNLTKSRKALSHVSQSPSLLWVKEIHALGPGIQSNTKQNLSRVTSRHPTRLLNRIELNMSLASCIGTYYT